MMNSTVPLAPAETAGQRDGTAHVEIQHMMAVLGRLELTYRARDAEDIQVARRGQHVNEYSAKPGSRQGSRPAWLRSLQGRCEKSSECARGLAQCPAIWRA